MKIAICKKFPKIKKFEKKLHKAFPEASVKVRSCIGDMCGKCKSMPVAKVDGEKLEGKKMGKVIGRIRTI